MKTPLAWCNLVQERPRTMVATAGVAFALTLVFMQLGFLGSVVNTATLITDQLDFDVVIVSEGYQHLVESGTFPRLRLYEALSVPGVSKATPVYVGLQLWRNGRVGENDDAKKGPDLGKLRAIMVLGFPVGDPPFLTETGHLPFPIRVSPEDLRRLGQAGTFLIDSRSHPSFEPRERGRFAEVGGRRLRVEGQFDLGISFASDGTLLVGDETFRDLFPGRSLDRVSLGLIKLDAPGTRRVEEVAARIRNALTGPSADGLRGRRDVLVLSRRELAERETRYWLFKKSIGLIFLFGVVVALTVGIVVVYQVLSSDIMDHYREYATLKAMGYTNRYLAWSVVQQALFLSLFGYVPALLAASWLYWFTRVHEHLPIAMTWWRAGLVLLLSSAICVGAALLSVRKVTASDPASLF